MLSYNIRKKGYEKGRIIYGRYRDGYCAVFWMTMVKSSTTHANPANYSRIYRSRGRCKIARTKMNRYTAVILGFSPLVVASFGRGGFVSPGADKVFKALSLGSADSREYLGHRGFYLTPFFW